MAACRSAVESVCSSHTLEPPPHYPVWLLSLHGYNRLLARDLQQHSAATQPFLWWLRGAVGYHRASNLESYQAVACHWPQHGAEWTAAFASCLQARSHLVQCGYCVHVLKAPGHFCGKHLWWPWGENPQYLAEIGMSSCRSWAHDAEPGYRFLQDSRLFCNSTQDTRYYSCNHNRTYIGERSYVIQGQEGNFDHYIHILNLTTHKTWLTLNPIPHVSAAVLRCFISFVFVKDT